MNTKLSKPVLSELYHYLKAQKNHYLMRALWSTLTAEEAEYVDPTRYASEMHNMLHGSVDV